MAERIDELVQILDAPVAPTPSVADLVKVLDAPVATGLPLKAQEAMQRKMAEAKARPPEQYLPSAMEMVSQLYEDARAGILGPRFATLDESLSGISEAMRPRAAALLNEKPWMMPAGPAETTVAGQFFGAGRIGPTLALWRNLFYGVGTGMRAGAKALGIVSPQQGERWRADMEKTFFENLERGVKVWGQALDRNARGIAKKVSLGSKSAEETIYRAARQGPEVLAAIIGQPGLLETKQVVPYAEPETFIGKGASLIADAAEFFGGLHGIGRLTGTGKGLSGLALRAASAAVVTETQHEVPSVQRFAENAAIYFALIGSSQKVRAGLERVMKRAPIGKLIGRLNAGGKLDRAIAVTLDKGGRTARYMLVERADDWMESLFDSLYYAWRARPEETSFFAAFLGALPASLAINYLEESVGDLPELTRMTLRGRISQRPQAERVEEVQRMAEPLRVQAEQEAAPVEVEMVPEVAAGEPTAAIPAGVEPRRPAALPKTRRVQRMQAAIAGLRHEIWEAEQAAKVPTERAAVQALEHELEALIAAEETIAGVPERYSQELEMQTAPQLADAVSRRGKARTTPEERSAARLIRDVGKRVAEIRRKYTAELRGVELTPILAHLRGGKGRPGRQIWWDPKLHPEVRDWLEGKDISVRRYFTTTAKPSAESLDGIADELKRRNILAEDLHETAVLEALDRELALPRTWEALLRQRAADEERLIEEAEATGRGVSLAAVGYVQDRDALDRAYSEAERAAGRLREARVEEMALAGMPHAAKAAKVLRAQISKMEKLSERAAEATQTAIQQELARLHEEVSNLERQLAEEGDLPELRRYIAQLRAVKGISQRRFGEIVAKHSKPMADGRKHRTTTGIREKGVLLNIVAAVERERPKTIGHKTVITAKRERHIQELRQNLIAEGAETDADFVRQLRELRIVEPRYVDGKHFITDQQGRRLIDKMIAERPLIAHREATRRALADNPQAAQIVAQIEAQAAQRRAAMEAEGKKYTPNPLVDFRYYLAGMDEATGADFYDAGMAMVKGKREAELAVQRDFDRITEAVGKEAYKRIASDREALDRVNDQIASKLKRPGAPPKPTDITEDEVRMAQAIEVVLHDQRNQVRWERFLRWRFKGTGIPDADTQELTRAEDIYESEGPEAARRYLDSLTWGVIKSGYEPESVVIPRIHHAPEPPMRYGDRGIEAREAVFQRQEKNILARLDAYLVRRYQAALVTPRIRTFAALWDAHADAFASPQRVARELGFAISEISGAPASDHPLARTVRRMYSHALLAKVLIDPAKSLRNVCQTAAFYTDRTDLFHPGIFQAVTADDWAYYREHVSQLGGLKRDYFMEQEKPLVLDWWVRKARQFAPYKWSDEYPRRWCYAAKLARVDRALKAHPDDIGRMLRAAAMQDLDARQVRAAVEILARDGEDAFKRFVAHEMTNNVHFVYGREQRAVVEMREEGRIIGNLMTFPRSYLQRVAKNTKKVFRGTTLGERWRGLKTVLSILVGGWLVGEGYKRLYGQRRNPYNILQILNWTAGGLMLGAVDAFSDLLWETESAVMGTPGALDRAMRAVTQLPAMFCPGYAEALDAIEGVSGTRDLDVYALRQLRRMLNSRYKPRDPNVQRTLVERWQKILVGGADQPLAGIATPEAVELARREGADVRQIEGTLSGGRVGVDDVKGYLYEAEMERRRRTPLPPVP